MGKELPADLGMLRMQLEAVFIRSLTPFIQRSDILGEAFGRSDGPLKRCSRGMGGFLPMAGGEHPKRLRILADGGGQLVNPAVHAAQLQQTAFPFLAAGSFLCA
ncbi:hypothetical protein D3C73_771970 [compost metagenome]